MKGARFMTMDISNFYLMTPLLCVKFIQIKLSGIPDKVNREYKLREKATKNGSINIRAKHGMYSLPQAGLLANELLEKCLNKHGYQQSKLVPGLWKHDTRPIRFTLVVNDFGIKYIDEEHAQHLKNALKEHYKLTCNWTLDWAYNKLHVHLSMPNYMQKSFETISTQSGQTTACTIPNCTNPIWCKETIQTQEPKAPLLDNKAKGFIQQVCDKFLFLGIAVDSTLLCPISAIALQSSKPIEDTMQQTLQLLNYLATQEDAVLSYHASNMMLAVHSDTSYLSKPKAQSQVGEHFFLLSNTTVSPNNGAILNIAHIIKNVMSSATEAELAGLYILVCEAVYIRIIIEELGHVQPPTPLQTDHAMSMALSMVKYNSNKPKPWA